MIRCYRTETGWEVISQQTITFTGMDPSEKLRVAVFTQDMQQIAEYHGYPEPVTFNVPPETGDLTIRVRAAGSIMPFETTYDPGSPGQYISEIMLPLIPDQVF